MNLHKKLKFYTEGDEVDTLLGIPVEEFYRDDDVRPLRMFSRDITDLG